LSQTPKRPGTRDISELKARLGLKKAAPEAKAPAAKPSGGVAPPPGLAVPAPKQSGPVIPAAADDPFGNMNAMAQIGTMQRAPEIVIVNDGNPVESVSTGSKAATIAKYAAIALVPLIIGWQLGGIGQSAKQFNKGIDDAGRLEKRVAGMRKDLSDLSTDLGDAIKKTGGQPDPAITKVLIDAQKKSTFHMPDKSSPDAVKEPEDNSKEYAISEGGLDPALSRRVVQFYAHVNQLALAIDDHVKAAKIDDATIASGAAAEANTFTATSGQKMLKYWLVLYNPTDAERNAKDALNLGQGGSIGANLVEVGPIMCDANTYAKDGQCASGTPGLGFRLVSNGPNQDAGWTRGEVLQKAPSPGGSFPNNQLISLVRTPILESMLKGGTPTASELLYQGRLQNIMQLSAELKTEAEELSKKLADGANTDHKRFTWLM
jgi:hypothetical protein